MTQTPGIQPPPDARPPAVPAAGPEADAAPFRRLALEAGPLVVFFVTNNLYGIMIGTGAFMAATAVSLTLSLRLERRVPLMPLVGAVFVLIFGGLTLALDDDLFIKLKPTVVNCLFATILFVGLATGRSLLKLLMGSMLQLDEAGWRSLTWRWAFFFVALAILNEIVWRNFSTDFWVNFKVFGLMPLSVLGAAQIPLILRHQIPAPGSDGDRPA